MPPSNRKVPRLKDVAEAAQVSIATASRILNGDADSFGEKTQLLVTETATRLGWRRNLLVSGIQTGSTRTVGVMIPPHDSFWVGVLAGIHIELAEADFLPITVWVRDCREIPNFEKHDQQGLEQINRLLDRRVDGLILWPSFAVAYYEHYQELIERRIPVAVIDHKLTAEGLADSIETDEEQAATLVAEHLISLGHERIACFSARETEWQAWSIRRRTLFEQAVARISGTQVRSYKTNARGDNADAIAREILTADPCPTAVYAVTDHMARHIYRAARSLGIRIPEDVSVVGFADLEFAQDLVPSLTTIRQSPEQIGQFAAKSILARLKSPEAAHEPALATYVPTELVARESTATLAQ